MRVFGYSMEAWTPRDLGTGEGGRVWVRSFSLPLLQHDVHNSLCVRLRLT